MLSFLRVLGVAESVDFIQDALNCKQLTAKVIAENVHEFFAPESVADLEDTNLKGCELLFKQLIGVNGYSYAISDLCSWLKVEQMRKLLLNMNSDAHKLSWKELEPWMKNIHGKHLKETDFKKHLAENLPKIKLIADAAHCVKVYEDTTSAQRGKGAVAEIDSGLK